MKFTKYITEMTFGSVKDYQKLANYYVGNFGKEAKNKFKKLELSKTKSPQQKEELQREVFNLIDKLFKKLGV